LVQDDDHIAADAEVQTDSAAAVLHVLMTLAMRLIFWVATAVRLLAQNFTTEQT
jgi:hypothetical protein